MKIREIGYSVLVAVVLAVALLVAQTASPVAASSSWPSFADLRRGTESGKFEAPKPWSIGLTGFGFKHIGQDGAKTFEDVKATWSSVGHWQAPSLPDQSLESLLERFRGITRPNLGSWGGGIQIAPSRGGG